MKSCFFIKFFMLSVTDCSWLVSTFSQVMSRPLLLSLHWHGITRLNSGHLWITSMSTRTEVKSLSYYFIITANFLTSLIIFCLGSRRNDETFFFSLILQSFIFFPLIKVQTEIYIIFALKICYLFYLDQVGSGDNCSTERLCVLSLLAPTQEDGFLEPHQKGI